MRYAIVTTKAQREAAEYERHAEQQRLVAELSATKPKLSVAEANRLLYGYADEDEQPRVPLVAARLAI